VPATRRALRPAAPDPAAFAVAEAGLAALAGLAPSDVLRRRLERSALLAPAIDSPPDLASPGWAALLDVVTVQETRLFRAAPQLLALAALLPALPGGPLRLLSAGCASGEEAWSLAILAAAQGIEAEVLGLDLCRPALALAEAARYPAGPPDALREVPGAFLSWFIQDAGWVLPRADGLTRPVFRRANLLDLPEETGRFGAILCRNVLIYLLPAARDAVLRGLVARLLPGGALLLGPTDMPGPGLPLRAEPGAHGIWRRL
jgi:chemotaxis protein methyltransferase CheR